MTRPAASQDLTARRAAGVREHMELERRRDFAATLGAFGKWRCELSATGEIYDGEAEVRRYFAATRAAFITVGEAQLGRLRKR